MTIKRLLAVLKWLLVAIFLFTVVACSMGAPAPTYPAGSNVEVNVGDMWYLPINKDGLPESNIDLIFTEIEAWQVEHPTLEIVDVDYLYMQNTYSGTTSNYTYGVSLLTKVRE